ncbi:MAG: hypothetical protein QXD04_01755, partial [Candidatus Bathyarchaeia archaeon]
DEVINHVYYKHGGFQPSSPNLCGNFSIIIFPERMGHYKPKQSQVPRLGDRDIRLPLTSI